jgi:hypothetical protein
VLILDVVLAFTISEPSKALFGQDSRTIAKVKIFQDVDVERAILAELQRSEGGGNITLGLSGCDLERQSGENAPCDESAKHCSCAWEKERPVCSWPAGH